MHAAEASAPLTLIAEYRARPGRGDEVSAILARHVPATRQEPGCITFIAYRDADDPDHFILYEQYVDEAALTAHRQAPHFAANVDRGIVPLLDERTARRYDEVAVQAG